MDESKRDRERESEEKGRESAKNGDLNIELQMQLEALNSICTHLHTVALSSLCASSFPKRFPLSYLSPSVVQSQ